MIPQFRKAYNAAFTEGKYQAFLEEIAQAADGHHPRFHIAETPIFVPKEITGHLMQACDEIIDLITRADFKELSKGALLPENYVPGETEHTTFLVCDFGICEDENGDILPQLIEAQGFPSLFVYQDLCARAYRQHFDIPKDLNHLFGGLTAETYLEKLRRVILGDSRPENVVLLDIAPHKQNTQVDFWVTQKALGIHVVDLAGLKVSGRDVYYLDERGRRVPVERIYNRVIFDELVKTRGLKREFYFKDEHDIRWVGHPHWFFRISKHTLPFFKSKYVPATFFLGEMSSLTGNLEDYVLKPLYSFSGEGVLIRPTLKDIEAIPSAERNKYILQKRVNYLPIIDTLDVPAKAEIRMMFVWEDEAPRPEVLTNLVRLSKGEMVGVKYNMDKTWVGGSAGFFEQ
ncbi:MAG: hypothetical protein EPO28_10040 [Saprospiraceae bacterium]|nr:MAG: hypothetical protein EPO28_10040 [Saprospiraceae bacterium]